MPSQFSTNALFGSPPAAIAKLDVPKPFNATLAVFKLFTSVHEVPFQDSVLTVAVPFGGSVSPPNPNEAVLTVPADPNNCLAVLTSLTSLHVEPL